MSAYGYIIASWYIEIADGKIVNAAPFISGEIVITRNGANYTAEFDTVDDIGNNITGTYEGEFTYRDMTASAAAQKAAGPHIRKNHVRKANFGKSEEMRMPVIGSRLKLNY